MVRRHLPVGLAAALSLPCRTPAAEAALRFERCGGYGYAVRAPAGAARPHGRGARAGCRSGSSACARGSARRAGRCSSSRAARASRPRRPSPATAAGLLYAAYRSRDVIVFDQRGTGRSGALRCRSLEQANLLDATDGGRRAAPPGSARGAPSTRPPTRWRTWRRSGASWASSGSPSTAPPTAPRSRSPTRSATRRTWSGWCSTRWSRRTAPTRSTATRSRPRRAPCGRSAAAPAARSRAIRSADLERLVAAPARAVRMRGRLVDERGRARRSSLTRPDVFGVLLAGDFDPALRAAFPGAVRSALARRRRADAAAAPARVQGRRRGRRRRACSAPPSTRPPRCEETTLPVAAHEPGRSRRCAAARPRSRSRRSRRPVFAPVRPRHGAAATTCSRSAPAGPPARPAPALGPGPLPNVPVLLLEGEDDLRTPVEGARRVAALLPPGQARDLGRHRPLRARLGPERLRAPRVRPLLPRRAGAVALPAGPAPVPPQPPAPAAAGARGRAPRRCPARAGARSRRSGLTLRDVLDDAVTELIFAPDDPDLARGGGLRQRQLPIGGRGTLVLSGVAFVPGVRLSGRIRRFGERRQRGRLRVSGPGAPDGLLRVRGTRVEGPLGGRRVRARLDRPASDGAGATPPEAALMELLPARDRARLLRGLRRGWCCSAGGRRRAPGRRWCRTR